MTESKQPLLDTIKEKLFVISIFFFLFVITYTVSKQFGLANAFNKSANEIIFLPAGARLLACLVGSSLGAIGVGIASWLIVSSDVFPNQSQGFYLSVAILNSCSVLFSVMLAQQVLGIERSLKNLKFFHLPLIDLLATFMQALCMCLFLYSQKLVAKEDLIAKFSTQMVGNFLGGMIFMLAFMLVINLHNKTKSIN